MSWHQGDTKGGVRSAALPDAVEGYQGRGVEGAAYRPRAGCLFRDEAGATWHESSDSGSHESKVRGGVLACSAAYNEAVHVRGAASDALRIDADAAFRRNSPFSAEKAVEVAASIPRAGT